jgi:hypothetical protein
VDSDLPFIDEHRVLVSAPAPAVWRALAARKPRLRPLLAHLLRTEPRHTSGTALEEGSTSPGFKVEKAEPEHRVVLTGSHPRARYALVFILDAQPDGTMLSARSYAQFPGLQGWVYRRLVIECSLHRIAVSRLLRTIARKATAEIS